MKKSTLKVLFILAIMIAVSYYSFYLTHTSKITLNQIITNVLKGSKGEYSIAIKNLKTGEEYSINSHKTYKTGSLYKLWIMSTAYEKIQEGTISEDESLTGDIETLNNKFDIDPEFRELTDGTINFTVSSALRQMITISHNYAALILTERIGLSNIKTFLEKHGFVESSVGGSFPVSNPNDIALFLEKLYKGELSTPENTKKMLELLKKQELNDKLPKYLPSGTVVAHKTGEIDFLTHDAGIVYTKNGDYIIVVFSESNNPAGAEDRIAQISKAVYDYFMSSKNSS
ncbi:serine hydrolase [Candidatus Roizmanbacteria bacterium]|nr:serine hydrolase [Candidatus Roizmanbacteria bacterium]